MSELLRFLKDMRDNGYGMAEIAAELGTSAIAEPVAGYAAMYDPEHGAEAIREGMTYEPKSEAAKQYKQAIGGAVKAAVDPVAPAVKSGVSPIIDAWKRGVDIAGDYNPYAGAILRTVPTAISAAMGVKPAMQSGSAMREQLIANANAPRTINRGYMGQRGAVGHNVEDKPYVSWSEDRDVHYDEDGNETPGDEYAIIDKIYVPEVQRKQGIARKMLRETINEIQTASPGMPIRIAAYPFGENKIDMQDLVDFYESEGFDVINTDGHAVIMELK